MADFDSSLPVRTQNPGDVIVKIADATTPSQQLTVNPDGSINSVVTATDLDIRDLNAAQDNVAISDGTDTLAVNADGSINSVVTATDLDIRNLAFAQDNVNARIQDTAGNSLTSTTGSLNTNITNTSIAVTATNLDIRDLAFATDKVDVSGSTVVVTATDLDIRDLSDATDSVSIGDGTDTLAVNADGSINVVVSDTSGGVAVNSYKDASAIAAGASDNHDYTVTAGKTLHLNQIESSASGKAKMVLQIETGVATGVFTPFFAQFNSTATPNMSIQLQDPPQIAAGVRVRVVMTNRDLLAMDLYSTISGFEV